MKICITIKEALKIAEYTGQLIKITLKSGKELIGVVEELWPTSCRLWVNPQVNNSPRPEIEKAIVAIHAIRCIAFDWENMIENRFFKNISVNRLQGIRDALNVTCITRQLVKIGKNRNGHTKCIEGYIVSVSTLTCCINLKNSSNTIEEYLGNIEYVLFS